LLLNAEAWETFAQHGILKIGNTQPNEIKIYFAPRISTLVATEATP
jgi:hypothetical protein